MQLGATRNCPLACVAAPRRQCVACELIPSFRGKIHDLAMPSEEYSNVSSGALKLKGVNSSSKIQKRKKKRRKSPDALDESSKSESLENAKSFKEGNEGQDAPNTHTKRQDSTQLDTPAETEDSLGRKTEAERHYDEMRRKRLNGRLKKEGTKTHKERVEELNRYLNKLSEHHDM